MWKAGKAITRRVGIEKAIRMLRRDGWGVNHKRVERIWRREGLKVPKKQPRRGRLWLADRFMHPATTDS